MFQLDRKVQALLLLVLAALLFGGGIQYGRRALPPPPPVVVPVTSLRQDTGTSGAEQEAIYVHVIGAVRQPGVYVLKAGDRVLDAVKLAILLPDANPDALNMAAPLRDGLQLVVPRLGQEGGQVPQDQASSASSGLIDLNTATSKELEQLPGIGPALAQRIISYRDQNGIFRSADDLLNVSGIGPARLEQLRPLVQ